jgi:hypothetical protein
VPHQLNWLDRPAPQPDVWDRLNDAQRTTVIDTMARVIGKAVVPTKPPVANEEKIHD